jgi:inner membrane protein
MTGKSHLTLGVVASLGINVNMLTEPPQILIESPIPMLVLAVAMTIGLLLGSLFPDIDHHKSYITNKIPLARLLKIKHRGITHSLLGLAITFGVFFALVTLVANIGGRTGLITFEQWEGVSYILGFFCSGFVYGFGLHILADMVTQQGVKLLYPINISIGIPWGLGIKTGSFTEHLAVTAASALVLIDVARILLA